MLGRIVLLVAICIVVEGQSHGPEVRQRGARRSCPFGFVGHGSSCYLFSHSEATFEGAHAFCDYFSSHLARITSIAEENFIRGYLQRNGKGKAYFIDGTDMRVEGVWTWDKPFRKMTYFDWGPGEPTAGHQNCLVLLSDYGFRFDNYHCSIKSQFVCETEKK